MNESSEIDYFFRLSVVLTGYVSVQLHGTGQGEFYFESLREILGPQLVSELLNEFKIHVDASEAPKGKPLKELVKTELLEDDKWGPVCRNIIQMWYMGNWYQMPTEWRENYVFSQLDETKVLSANSYIEGLVWKAMGRHPKSAKQPGYGTWAFPPEPLPKR